MLLSGRPGARITLGSVAFEVTGECNLDCLYCYNVWKHPSGGRDWAGNHASARRTLRILGRQAQIGTLAFTGGEPFLVDRLPELILTARMRGWAVSVITNGTVASRDRYAHAIQAGAGLFQLPFLSHEPTVHDGLTGTPGSWGRVVASLDVLAGLGARVVAVIVLTRGNVQSVDGTLAWLAQHGIVEVMLNRFNVGGRGIRARERLSPSVAELRDGFRAADAAARRLALAVSSNISLPYCVARPPEYPGVRFTSCPAQIPGFPITVTATGEVRLCNHSPVVLGNLFQTPLRQVLQVPYVRDFIDGRPEECAACTEWRACRGGCRAASEQLGCGHRHADPVARQALLEDGRSAPGGGLSRT